MDSAYLENFEIIDTYVQNDYQKIFICKHKENNNLYLLNSITEKTVVSDVDFDNLKNNVNAIEEIYETDESIDIITEYNRNNSLEEYISSNKMTLASQINYTSFIMNKIIRLKNQPNRIFLSMFNHNSLQIYENGSMGSAGILLLRPNYINVGTEEVLRAIANVLHIIFSGKEIEDNKVLKHIPPDISRLITNCLEDKYIRLIDLVSDYKSSNLYKLINPERQESKRVHTMRKNLSRKRFKYKIKSKAIVILIILIPVIAFAVDKIIDTIKLRNDTTIEANADEINKNKENDTSTITDTENQQNSQDNTEDHTEEINDILIKDNSTETISDFFSEDMNLDDETNIGVIDSEKFHKGTSSIKASNDTQEKQSFLIGYIDFNDEKFSYLKDRVVNASLWLNSNGNTECSVVLKLGNEDKILTYTSRKADLVQNNWILQNLEVNTKNGDYIKIYITVDPNEEIWIDTIDIDVLK
ncbi:hypothetical protein [Brassicibacter mesophilus]|uniref:hypothetical protein n=1 Tax=Brassicibacter mesophilus TaxID=745119 RepID=UPI003D190C9A